MEMFWLFWIRLRLWLRLRLRNYRLWKKLELQLVLRPCSSSILLAGGHFLLVLVNDFVRGYLLRALPIGQVSYLSWTTGRDVFEPCFILLCTCKKPFLGITNTGFFLIKQSAEWRSFKTPDHHFRVDGRQRRFSNTTMSDITKRIF